MKTRRNVLREIRAQQRRSDHFMGSGRLLMLKIVVLKADTAVETQSVPEGPQRWSDGIVLQVAVEEICAHGFKIRIHALVLKFNGPGPGAVADGSADGGI